MTNPLARSPDLAGSPSRYASIESLKSPSIPESAFLQKPIASSRYDGESCDTVGLAMLSNMPRNPRLFLRMS